MTSPNQPNIFFLGGQIELEHINKVSWSKKIVTHVCAELNIPKPHRMRGKKKTKKNKIRNYERYHSQRKGKGNTKNRKKNIDGKKP